MTDQPQEQAHGDAVGIEESATVDKADAPAEEAQQERDERPVWDVTTQGHLPPEDQRDQYQIVNAPKESPEE